MTSRTITLLSKVFLVLSFAVSFFPSAGLADTSSKEKFALIQVPELKRLMADKTILLTILDANNEKTRKKEGVIPGAVLLSSSSNYDITKELPSDKNSELAFYCANTRCTASHTAAARATDAGYTRVSVFSEGIQGWKAAGEEVVHPQT